MKLQELLFQFKFLKNYKKKHHVKVSKTFKNGVL